MDVCDTAHGYKGEVVQEPAHNRIETRVVDVVDIDGLQVVVATLPADEVPDDHQSEDTEGCGGAPVHGRITEKEVLNDCRYVR